jgi:hypothetical protein
MEFAGRFQQQPQRAVSVEEEERKLASQLHVSNDYQAIIQSGGWPQMVKWIKSEIDRIHAENETLNPFSPANQGRIAYNNGRLRAFRAFIERPEEVVENTKKAKIAEKLNQLRAKFSREG